MRRERLINERCSLIRIDGYIQSCCSGQSGSYNKPPVGILVNGANITVHAALYSMLVHNVHE